MAKKNSFGGHCFVEYVRMYPHGDQQIEWLAATCGALQGEIDRLKREVTKLKTARTREKTHRRQQYKQVSRLLDQAKEDQENGN